MGAGIRSERSEGTFLQNRQRPCSEICFAAEHSLAAEHASLDKTKSLSNWFVHESRIFFRSEIFVLNIEITT